MEHHEVIEDSLLYIEKNIEQSLSLTSVADTFNMSKYYFHRLFSAVMGCSLNNYLLARRLNASLKLIQQDHLSLTDIAYRLNFGSQSSFTRAFKRQYGMTPSSVRGNSANLPHEPIPPVVKRTIKNINGDVVTDFTLTEFETIRLSGIAFEVDLAEEDYKEKIRTHSKMLLENIDERMDCSCFVIYSNCQPDSTRFKVFFGIPQEIQVDKPFYFTVDVPDVFCAKFKYSGDILDIGDVLKTDYARFLKITKQETEDSDIELIQSYDDVHNLDAEYHIYAPVKKLPMDSEL
jgi:AraC family transcriptional regulator